MSPKLVAFLILAILSLSILLTGVAAISAAQSTGQTQPVTGLSGQQNDQGDGESALVGSLKFICPFH